MLFIKIYLNSLKQIKAELFSYLFLFLQFVVFSRIVWQFGTDEFIVINLGISILFCIIKTRYVFNNKLFYIIFVFILLNVIPFLTFGWKPNTFIGYLIRLATAFFILYSLKNKFIEYFENLVFILASISLIFFIIQIINPEFFRLFNPISDAVLFKIMKIPGREGFSHQYLFVYLFNGWGILRNSGFMSEPSAFGAVLTWAMLINLFFNKFRINFRFAIMFTAAITTFSVGTFLYLFLMVLTLIIQGRISSNITKAIFLSGLVFIILFNLNITSFNLNMMKEKIETEPLKIAAARAGRSDASDISRVASFDINIKYFLKWPLGYGYGIERGTEFLYLGQSPNGLMTIMVTWGIFGLYFLALGFYKLTIKLREKYSVSLKPLTKIAVLILFILPISGFSFHNQQMFLALILAGYLYRVKKTT